MKKKTKVVVFDDCPEYVHILVHLLLRDGYDAVGILVTPRISPEDIARAVRESNAKVLIADGDCNGEDDYGLRVIELCRDIPGIHIMSSSGKSNARMEQASHRSFTFKQKLLFGCNDSKKRFLEIVHPLAA